MKDKKIYLVKKANWYDKEYLIKAFIDYDVAIKFVCRTIIHDFTFSSEDERLIYAKKFIMDIDCDFTEKDEIQKDSSSPKKSKKESNIKWTKIISNITGLPECKDCEKTRNTTWKTHCITCGQPVVY